MLRQDFIQHIGGVMEGKGDVPDFPLVFPLLQMLKHTAGLDFMFIANGIQVVQQEIIEVFHAAICKLLLENINDLLLFLDDKGRKLRGQKEGLPGLALHQTFLDGIFAFPIVIDIACIKVIVARRHIFIHHATDCIKVNALRIVGFERKPHPAEPQILSFHCSSLLSHVARGKRISRKIQTPLVNILHRLLNVVQCQ